METNIAEWQGVALGAQPNWEWRSNIIAKFLRPNDIVIDIGAGDQKLRKYLPDGCMYHPIDCVDDLPGTFLVDFNKEFRIPEINFTVAVCAGSLEYINDLVGFFRSFSQNHAGKHVIFTYYLDPNKSRRDSMKSHNNFNDINDIIETIGFAFSYIDVLATHRKTVFISATLSHDNRRKRVDYRPLNELLSRHRRAGFFTRISRSIKKRMPGAS